MLEVDSRSVELDGVEIAYRTAGSGERLLVLIHGWPQTGLCWRHVMEPLSRNRTVIAPDLRGYGASGLAGEYDKRSTAADLSRLIHHLGFDSAAVVGHDRGARVAHRWALDHPDDVDALVLLDILPTRSVMRSFDRESATAMWHWFFHRQPELAAELILGNVGAYLEYFYSRVLETGAVDPHTFDQYVAAYSDRAHLEASLRDYQAGFTTDLSLDETDFARGIRLHQPLLVLWGAEGGLAQSEVLPIWKEHHTDSQLVTGHAVPGGHYVPEEAPVALVDALGSFLP